jgi:hypothetical protein
MTGVRLEFSEGDVLLCLGNAAGLREDALRSSRETELVLLTFSIEEAAKGFVIVFERKLASEGVDPGSAASLSRISDPGLRTIFERHKDILSPEAVRRAFYKHDVKQRHLRFVADYCLYLAPMSILVGARELMVAPGVALGTRFRALFWQADHKDGKLNEKDRAILKTLDSVDHESLEDLRKRALYVNLATPSGGCKPTAADDSALDWLEDVSSLLIGMLEGAMVLQSKVTPTEPAPPAN